MSYSCIHSLLEKHIFFTCQSSFFKSQMNLPLRRKDTQTFIWAMTLLRAGATANLCKSPSDGLNQRELKRVKTCRHWSKKEFLEIKKMKWVALKSREQQEAEPEKEDEDRMERWVLMEVGSKLCMNDWIERGKTEERSLYERKLLSDPFKIQRIFSSLLFFNLQTFFFISSSSFLSSSLLASCAVQSVWFPEGLSFIRLTHYISHFLFFPSSK